MGVHTGISWAVEQSEPVGPQVYRSLRERIIRGDLEPGGLISEAEIARAFSISRQPVREAFIKLAEEGLVEIRPQRGTLVRKINIASVMDARFVREAVEADIVRIVAERRDPHVVASLNAQIEAQRNVAHQKAGDFLQLDETFHRTLAAAADKAHVWSIVNNVKAQMDRLRQLSFIMSSAAERAVDQHHAIVEAIAKGDAQGADAAMRAHLRQILSDLPVMAELRPNYFDSLDFQSNAT
ncbi:GntR family transcriptional regulator [Taklimakanibacter lacteus]|uniref:GntR family transcriptional regulator n=1 Tax=Taklimakanibacter lacteus TaxID=2268456 RepID=UPI0034D3C48A